MDDLDHRLIAELRINARASIPTLASILGVARGTVQTRMERLMATGTIAGFTIRLKDHTNDDRIRAIMMVELAGRNISSAIVAFRRNPGFSAVHKTIGSWDLIAEIEVPSMAEFNRVVSDIRVMEGVARTETHLCLCPA